MRTDKLLPYKKGSFPQIAGGVSTFITDELRKVQNAVTSTQDILKDIETGGTVASKAGAVTASDVADGEWRVINDTTNGTVGLYANLGGTLFSVMLT